MDDGDEDDLLSEVFQWGSFHVLPCKIVRKSNPNELNMNFLGIGKLWFMQAFTGSFI